MSERYGVLVKDGVVVNSIVWNDDSEEQYANDGYDHYEETTHMNPRPGMYWTWSESDGYRDPRPYESWVWSEQGWVPPVAYPDDGNEYVWNEGAQQWKQQQPFYWA